MGNRCPISCLPLIWKLLTSIISDYLYRSLDEEKILHKEQKACKKNRGGTKNQALLDKAVHRN